MFIDKNSIIINGISVGQYLTEATYSFNKLWSEDTGRSLSGKYNGVLKGIFVKLSLNFRPLNKNEIETLAPILDSDFQNVTYYDPKKKQNVTMQTYTGDYEITFNGINKSKGFKISFIATNKRS